VIHKLFGLIIFVLGFAFLSGTARADTTYTYTGNPLALLVGPGNELDGCTVQTCRLTIQFTAPQPLAPNLFDTQISPATFSGNDTLTFLQSSDPAVQSLFIITTDSSGNITNWGVRIVDQLNSKFSLIFFTNNGQDFTQVNEAGFGVLAEADSTAVPGTWTMQTTGGGGGTNVPEPSSLLLLLTGLAVLVCFLLRNRTAQMGIV
jgi:hypothetical protein